VTGKKIKNQPSKINQCNLWASTKVKIRPPPSRAKRIHPPPLVIFLPAPQAPPASVLRSPARSATLSRYVYQIHKKTPNSRPSQTAPQAQTSIVRKERPLFSAGHRSPFTARRQAPRHLVSCLSSPPARQRNQWPV